MKKEDRRKKKKNCYWSSESSHWKTLGTTHRVENTLANKHTIKHRHHREVKQQQNNNKTTTHVTS